jgi:hypothetical protein
MPDSRVQEIVIGYGYGNVFVALWNNNRLSNDIRVQNVKLAIPPNNPDRGTRNPLSGRGEHMDMLWIQPPVFFAHHLVQNRLAF